MLPARDLALGLLFLFVLSAPCTSSRRYDESVGKGPVATAMMEGVKTSGAPDSVQSATSSRHLSFLVFCFVASTIHSFVSYSVVPIMDRFIKKFKRQTPVEEIIAQYGQDGLEGGSSRPAEESTEPTVPRGYKLIKVQQPDGAFITIRRKLATWHAMRQRDTVATTPNHSPRGSTRTVISRTSDGKLVRVERPVRDSTQATPRESMAYLRPGYAPGRMSNRASAVYSEQPNRDSTMTSTMTIIDAALDEQRRSHMERHHSQRSKRQSQRDSQRRSRRHSRGDGSSATAASRIASSGKTSAEIQIGHIEEIEEEDGESFYSSSDYDGYETGYLEDVDDIAYNPRNPGR